MMNKIKNILPPEINKHIIKKLCNQQNWGFPHDVESKTREDFFNEVIDKSRPNAGFALVTHDNARKVHIETDLNLYAEVIFYSIKQKLKSNIHSLSRIYWNYYDNSSVGNYHIDAKESNCKSIIYNLHSNDGGTFIKDKFIPSNEGEAIIFNSNIKHKGTPPIKNKHRFNLNMLCLCDR